MTATQRYHTPDGFDDLLLSTDGEVLTGVLFVGSSDAKKLPHRAPIPHPIPILAQAERWLDCYFSGGIPGPLPPYRIAGLTAFRQAVTDRMLRIPYGQTVSYGEIAAELAAARGIARMSAQAVGGAVGHNPISIIVPCHRVVGTNGSLTGYAGGLDRKIRLLEIEQTDMHGLFRPKKGTAI